MKQLRQSFITSISVVYGKKEFRCTQTHTGRQTDRQTHCTDRWSQLEVYHNTHQQISLTPQWQVQRWVCTSEQRCLWHHSDKYRGEFVPASKDAIVCHVEKYSQQTQSQNISAFLATWILCLAINCFLHQRNNLLHEISVSATAHRYTDRHAHRHTYTHRQTNSTTIIASVSTAASKQCSSSSGNRLGVLEMWVEVLFLVWNTEVWVLKRRVSVSILVSKTNGLGLVLETLN